MTLNKNKKQQEQYFHNIAFPTETMRDIFRKRLIVLRLKIDINQPMYKILYDLVTMANNQQMKTNSVGVTPEKFTEIVNKKMGENK